MPDLRPQFKHLHWRPMGHSFGVDVASDWADKSIDDPVFGPYKNCGLWTMEEAAILHNVALAVDGEEAIDIGAHTGWTMAHIEAAGYYVHAVDPCGFAFEERFDENNPDTTSSLYAEPSDLYFAKHFPRRNFNPSLICIDGDHSEGKPLEDAQNAADHLADAGVIMLHDGTGRPVREAVEWLMAHGFKARAYFTPHLVFCCWRGEFTPPDHVPDPIVKAAHLDGRYPDFAFEGMS